jgi:hypothetical protein
MQGRFKFEPAAHKACSASSRQIVLLNEQDLLTFCGAVQRGGQTGITCTDNDNVYMFAHVGITSDLCSLIGACRFILPFRM